MEQYFQDVQILRLEKAEWKDARPKNDHRQAIKMTGKIRGEKC
jgi:hypothetical protein